MKFILATFFVMGISGLAMAEGGRACKEDVEKFCKDVKPGGGRIVKCLKEHDAELSAACKGKREEMKEHMKEAHEACKEDIEKFCKDVKPGEGRVVECLKGHDSEISAKCKEMHQKMKENMKNKK